MGPLSMMGLMYSIGVASVEYMQDQTIEDDGNSVDEGQESGGSSTGAQGSAFMVGTAVRIGAWGSGVDPSAPAVEAVVEAVEKVYEEPEAAIVAAEIGCLSSSDCPPGFACVFSPGKEEGTCILVNDIGVRIVGIIDSVTCPYCLSMIGRTGTLDTIPIPPFHKHCRCSLEYSE
jgi:hypothetical protein